MNFNEQIYCSICKEKVYPREHSKVRCNVRMFRDEIFSVWRCDKCDSLHCLEEVDLEHYYRFYPFKNQSIDYITRAAFKNRLRILLNHGFRKHSSLLDFGCGSGLFLNFLKEKGYANVVGFDEFVSEFSNRNVLKDRYDFITAQDVIEHFDDPREFMESVMQCLAPEGILSIATPNASEISFQDLEKYLMELHQPYHRHIFSEASLYSLAKEYGLSACSVSKRFYLDTLYPAVNTRFIKGYIQKSGNFIDVATEPPRIYPSIFSPRLLLMIFFGYFFRSRGNMQICFQRINKNA